MKDVVKGYLAAIVSAVTFGMIPLFMIPIKQQNFSVDAALFYRFISTSILIVAYLIYRKESLRVTPREGFLLVVLGLLYAVSAEFLFLAYDLLSPGIASTIFFMYPLIVALILGFFFKETITLPTVIALFIVLIGVFFLSVKDIANFSINYIGACISLLGAFTYAIYMLIVNKSNISASGIKISFYSTLFSSLYFLLKLFFTGRTLPIPELKMAGLLVGFGVITTLLSIITLVYAIRMIGSTPTAIIGVAEPVVAVAISIWIFHEEEFTFNLFLGVCLIIIGVMIDILKPKKRKTA